MLKHSRHLTLFGHSVTDRDLVVAQGQPRRQRHNNRLTAINPLKLPLKGDALGETTHGQRLVVQGHRGELAIDPQKPRPHNGKLVGDRFDTGNGGFEFTDGKSCAGIKGHAVDEATVGVVAVGVITFFPTLLHLAVATGRADAVIAAGVFVVLVAIVAGFDTSPKDTIATTGFFAGVEAGVVVVFVAVVALFLAFLHKTIAATSVFALRRTAVFVVFVAIIATLNAYLDNAIATFGEFTSVGAEIVVVPVAIVTFFVEGISLGVGALLLNGSVTAAGAGATHERIWQG